MRKLQTESEWPREIEPLRFPVKVHLDRLEWWSIVSLLGGLALPSILKTPQSLVFGIVTASWALLNIFLTFAGRRFTPPDSLRTFAGMLLSGQFLNWVYVGAGLGAVVLSNDVSLRAGGAAVATQGMFQGWNDGRLLKACGKALRDN